MKEPQATKERNEKRLDRYIQDTQHKERQKQLGRNKTTKSIRNQLQNRFNDRTDNKKERANDRNKDRNKSKDIKKHKNETKEGRRNEVKQ